MSMKTASLAASRQCALDVLAENGISTRPVIPELIAEAFPFPLPVHESDGFPPRTYGALYKSGNDFRIVLSRDCPTNGHRRFTLSHELGHFFLNGHLDELFERGAEVHMSDTDHFRGMPKMWYELEADAFAAELLVPTPQAHEVIRGTAEGLVSIRAIADSFDSSLTCAAIRYAELTEEAAAIILSFEGVVEWVSLSARMREHGWARRRMKGEWAPPSSATAILNRDRGRIRANDSQENEGVLVEWFDNAPPLQIVEEALGLGQYGRILTVLTCHELPSVEVMQFREERRARGPRGWRDAVRTWAWDDFEDQDE